MRKLGLIGTFLILFLPAAGQAAFAEPLAYSGRDDGLSPTGQAVRANPSRVVPISYGTSYDNQFVPYSSFMQAPSLSQGPLQYQYGRQTVGSIDPAVAAGLNPSASTDPYHASEVSPYSHYSPYLEIVGEGSNYTLGIDDVVTIIVRDQPDFSGRFVIDPEGNIQYNFVGDIPADGKTKGELKAEITKRLTKFVRYPEVAVMISEYRSKAVYVFGFVNNPGKYAMKGDNISVKEAVVAAGLPRVDASLDNVYVIRPSDKNPDGKPSKRKVDLRKVLNKGEAAENFMLEPGDTVIVNQRYFDKFVNNLSRLTGPVFQSAALYEFGFGRRNGGWFRGSDN